MKAEGRGRKKGAPRSTPHASRSTPHVDPRRAALTRRAVLATPAETDQTFVLGARSATGVQQGPWGRDRFDHTREEIQRDVVLAWRDNPLARRIVNLTTQYVVGDGVHIGSKHAETDRFIEELWEHRLNRMEIRLGEWCDELTRTGNLLVLVTTDAGGMSYFRAVPASDISKIEHTPNDVEQPTLFHPVATVDNPDPPPWPAYSETDDGQEDVGAAPGGSPFRTVMVQYAVNRPVGAQWGESDLTPELRWMSRYNNWLEDRVRLNKYRQAFIWHVRGKYKDAAERKQREAELNLNPPSPGSVNVGDESETWEALSAKLESPDAERDGLAIKKMIATGAGVPLHFLAEPESSTRTTAEASGGPTYRHYEQRQRTFLWIVRDLMQIARRRRHIAGGRVSMKAKLAVVGSDISARDNAALATAAAQLIAVLEQLRGRRLIDDAELLRLIYKFAGEIVDVEEMLERGAAAPAPTMPAAPKTPAPIAKPDEATEGEEDDAEPDKLGNRRSLAVRALHEAPQPEDADMQKHLTIIVQPAPPVYIPPAEVVVNLLAPEIIVQPAPSPVIEVNVPMQTLPAIIVQPATHEIVVNVPTQPVPDVLITNEMQLGEQPAIVVNVAAPAVAVKVEAPTVNVANVVKLPTVIETDVVERDEQGRATKIIKTIEQEEGE